MKDVQYLADMRARLPKHFEAVGENVREVVVSCNECDATWTYDPDDFDTVSMLGAWIDGDLQTHAKETEGKDEIGHHDADITLVQSIREQVYVDTTVSLEDEEPE